MTPITPREIRTTWRTIKSLAGQYELPVRRIRIARERGLLEAWWLDGCYWINPASFNAWFASFHAPAKTRVKT